MLLVVTNKSDLACDYLILRLKERGIPFVRLNTEDYGQVFQVSMALMGDDVHRTRSNLLDGRLSDGQRHSERSIFVNRLAPDVSADVTRI